MWRSFLVLQYCSGIAGCSHGLQPLTIVTKPCARCSRLCLQLGLAAPTVDCYMSASE